MDFKTTQAIGLFAKDADTYANLPERLQRALTARDKLSETEQGLWKGVDNPTGNGARTAAKILDSLADGADVREALDQADADHLDRERRGRDQRLLEIARSHSTGHLSRCISEALPELLAQLRAELDPVIASLRECYAVLDGLPVDDADPVDVANASSAQRKALSEVEDLTRTYTRIRERQKTLLIASGRGAPGTTSTQGRTWDQAFELGLHELSRPTLAGSPANGRKRRTAVQAVVTREDVCLPDVDAMHETYDALHGGRQLPKSAVIVDKRTKLGETETPAQPSLTETNIHALDALTVNQRRA